MNLNTFAREITLSEGLKEQITIGQVKEVMHLIFHTLAKLPVGEIFKILRKYER